LNTLLSEDLQALKSQYELFAKEHLAPIADKLACQQVSLNEFLKLVSQSGYLGITVPKEYGGQGGNFLNLILFAEAMSFYDPGFGLTLAGHTTVVELIKEFGTDAQKSRYLPTLARGECLGAFAYIEDDLQEILDGTTTTVKSLEDKQNSGDTPADKVITGRKQSVINGRLAGVVIVLATELANKEQKPALWLVNGAAHAKSAKSHPQIAYQQNQRTGLQLGLSSTYLDDVQFNDCPVNYDNKLGTSKECGADEAKAICQNQIDFAQNISKTILAAGAVGLIEGALFRSANYARTEKRFGVPLKDSQAVQWKIADLATEGSAARLLTYRAAWSKEESNEEFSKNAAMCKSFAAHSARLHSAEALQIIGVKSDSADSTLARFYSDAKMIEMCEGTNEEQKVILGNALGI
jgi:alkylation response protein AidB-like acyl-CoA dehydrogenase